LFSIRTRADAKAQNSLMALVFRGGKDRKQPGATFNSARKIPHAQNDVLQTIAPERRFRTARTGMALAFVPKRCEVVAAFTNPTLHRTISQHFFISTEVPAADGTGESPLHHRDTSQP
jgi:hypothetical protein